MLRFFSLLLFVVSCAYSQSSSATIVGSVRDPAGAFIGGAIIKVTNLATRGDRESVTDASGAYRIPFLSPGEYSLSAMAPGFRPELVRRVLLTVNQTARLDFALQLGSVDQQIEVQAVVPLLNTDTATLGQVIESKQILELPLNGRQFLELALLPPGVTTGNGGPQSGSTSLFQRPGRIRV